jgi:hypothetical protein
MNSFSAIGLIVLIVGVLIAGVGLTYGVAHSAPQYSIITVTSPSPPTTIAGGNVTVTTVVTSGQTGTKTDTQITTTTKTTEHTTTATTTATTTSSVCPSNVSYQFVLDDESSPTTASACAGNAGITIYFMIDDSTPNMIPPYAQYPVDFVSTQGTINWQLSQNNSSSTTTLISQGSGVTQGQGQIVYLSYSNNSPYSNYWQLAFQCASPGEVCAIEMSWGY